MRIAGSCLEGVRRVNERYRSCPALSTPFELLRASPRVCAGRVADQGRVNSAPLIIFLSRLITFVIMLGAPVIIYPASLQGL